MDYIDIIYYGLMGLMILFAPLFLPHFIFVLLWFFYDLLVSVL